MVVDTAHNDWNFRGPPPFATVFWYGLQKRELGLGKESRIGLHIDFDFLFVSLFVPTDTYPELFTETG